MDKVIQELKELEVGKVPYDRVAAADRYLLAVDFHMVKPLSELDDNASYPFIKDKKIRASADGRPLDAVLLDHLHRDGEQVTVGGGYSVVRLATGISKKGLSGLEFAAGIPGSVGGAVYMNAGAHGSDISFFGTTSTSAGPPILIVVWLLSGSFSRTLPTSSSFNSCITLSIENLQNPSVLSFCMMSTILRLKSEDRLTCWWFRKTFKLSKIR